MKLSNFNLWIQQDETQFLYCSQAMLRALQLRLASQLAEGLRQRWFNGGNAWHSKTLNAQNEHNHSTHQHIIQYRRSPHISSRFIAGPSEALKHGPCGIMFRNLVSDEAGPSRFLSTRQMGLRPGLCSSPDHNWPPQHTKQVYNHGNCAMSETWWPSVRPSVGALRWYAMSKARPNSNQNER